MKISDFSASPTDSESPILLFFWCRKGGMDNHSLKLTEILHGRNILAVGTMGSYPDSPYGKLVYRNVEDQINQQNHCAGVFLSQGRIEESRTERRRSLPPDSPHYLDDEGYRRHLESRKHPDETDLENAWEFIYSKLIPDSCSSCCVIRSAPDI